MSLPTLILDIVPKEVPRKQAEENLEELLDLVKTAGGIVVEKIIQKRGRPSSKTFLGSGKIEEAADFAKANNIKLVILNGTLKPNQYIHLGKLFPKMKLWDRVDLILNIFEKHANAPEAKMQIKLARMHHEIPKIYARESTTLFERAGAGIGTRGAGEKGIEAEKRHIRKQIKTMEEKLKNIQKKQHTQHRARKKTGMPVVALVGYTNAGKSSLMRLLTRKKGVKVDDALFVTLETKMGKLFLPNARKNVLVADTIGFIRDLPPNLISSFLTTLQEAREADLLLHVIDFSDPKYEEKIQVVEEILEKIGCKNIPKIYVCNKLDRVSEKDLYKKGNVCFLAKKKYEEFSPQFVSVVEKEGIEELKSEIEKSV